MKEIKVNNCDNCPFSYNEYDDFAIGNDTINVCLLSIYNNQKEYIIDVYMQHERNDCNCDDGIPYEEYDHDRDCKCEEIITETPIWCLLKKDNYNISYNHNIINMKD